MNAQHLFKYLICLFLCFFTNTSLVYAGHYVYKQLSSQDGIPAMVNCIHAEKKGFVWIGSQNGLLRFDGYELKKYLHDGHDPSTLLSNHIFAITEDSLSNIWVMTDKGVSVYSRKDDYFNHFKTSDQNDLIIYSTCEVKGGLLLGARN